MVGIDLTDTRIAISGISGFIGSSAADRFRAAGAHVRGLVRQPLDRSDVEQVVGDINDILALERLVEGCSIVLHCVASHGPAFEDAHRVNVEGTRAIAEAALAAGCERFVHISTCGVYDLVDQEVVTERTPLWPFDEESELVYGVTKAEAERALQQVGAQGLPMTILRPPNVLGAHPRSTFSHRIAAWIDKGEATVPGDGANTWPYVYISNLLDAVDAVIAEAQAEGEAYTVVDGHTTWGEFLHIIAGWMGGEVTEVEKEPPYDYFYGRFSTEKAKRELGYQPRVDYETALRRTKAYLEEAGFIA